MLRELRPGARVLVRGRSAVFVKAWGDGAVVRYDDRPSEPKVVPFGRLEPHPDSPDGEDDQLVSGGAA